MIEFSYTVSSREFGNAIKRGNYTMKSLIAALVLMPVQAQAIDMLPQYETAKVERVSQPSKAKSKPKPKKVAKKKTYSFRPAPPPVSDGTKCYDPITVVGSQWVGESGAYESAVKAGKEAVRWRIGEMAMDPSNWKDVKKRCSLSSVGEVIGQTFHRCEIVLTPCRPGMKESP
jgi:hypothetical protein